MFKGWNLFKKNSIFLSKNIVRSINDRKKCFKQKLYDFKSILKLQIKKILFIFLFNKISPPPIIFLNFQIFFLLN